MLELHWILDLLSERPQAVDVGTNTSHIVTLSMGTPQGWLYCQIQHEPDHQICRLPLWDSSVTMTKRACLVGGCQDNVRSPHVEKSKKKRRTTPYCTLGVSNKNGQQMFLYPLTCWRPCIPWQEEWQQATPPPLSPLPSIAALPRVSDFITSWYGSAVCLKGRFSSMLCEWLRWSSGSHSSLSWTVWSPARRQSIFPPQIKRNRNTPSSQNWDTECWMRYLHIHTTSGAFEIISQYLWSHCFKWFWTPDFHLLTQHLSPFFCCFCHSSVILYLPNWMCIL